MFLPLPVCVKSSEVLVSLVSTLSCTISTCAMHVRLVMSVVYVLQRRSPARGDDCHSLSQQCDRSAVVSARAHGFYTVPHSYEFFLQVDALRTVSTRQNKECLTERQWDPCSVECTGTFN